MVRDVSGIVIIGERVSLVYNFNFFFTSTNILCTEPIMKGVSCQCTIKIFKILPFFMLWAAILEISLYSALLTQSCL